MIEVTGKHFDQALFFNRMFGVWLHVGQLSGDSIGTGKIKAQPAEGPAAHNNSITTLIYTKASSKGDPQYRNCLSLRRCCCEFEMQNFALCVMTPG